MISSFIVFCVANVAIASAGWEDCKEADAAYKQTLFSPAIEGACQADATDCPVDLQTSVDEIYAACGGLEEAGAEWDSGSGAIVKKTVEKCGCSGGASEVVFSLSEYSPRAL
jgi:hypothetical protein